MTPICLLNKNNKKHFKVLSNLRIKIFFSVYNNCIQQKGDKMKRPLLLSLVLLPLLANALSIDEVIQESVKTHPQVQMEQEKYLSEKELLTRAKSGYLPSVDLSYTVGPEVTKTPANNRNRASLTQQQASVTLTQNIFRGLGDMHAIAQQKAIISSSNDKVKESANKLALEAATAYLEVLKTYNLVQVNIENVAVHKKYLDQIEKSVKAGVGRTSDYKQTLSRYQNALNIRYIAEQNYLNAISSFKRIYPGDINVKDLEKPAVGPMPANDMASLVEVALQNNPTIKVSHDDIKAAQEGLKRTNAPFFPSADIQLKSYWNEDVHGVGYNGQEGKDTGYSALLILNYNIFNGLADRSAKQASKHQLLNKDYTLADAQRFIRANTEIAWQTYNLTKKQLVYISNYQKYASDTVADYYKEHQLGRRSIIDLLNIELEHNNASNAKVSTEYDNLIAYYQILSYTGKLVENLDSDVK